MNEIFSTDEKRAIAGILSALVYADGFIHTREMDYMARVKYGLDISDDLYAEGLKMEPAAAFSIVSAMSSHHKERVGDILMKMAYADGDLSTKEYEIVAGVALRCGIEFGGNE